MREHPPIAVCDLADHIERLKANDALRFSQEYEVTLAAVLHVFHWGRAEAAGNEVSFQSTVSFIEK